MTKSIEYFQIPSDTSVTVLSFRAHVTLIEVLGCSERHPAMSELQARVTLESLQFPPAYMCSKKRVTLDYWDFFLLWFPKTVLHNETNVNLKSHSKNTSLSNMLLKERNNSRSRKVNEHYRTDLQMIEVTRVLLGFLLFSESCIVLSLNLFVMACIIESKLLFSGTSALWSLGE